MATTIRQAVCDEVVVKEKEIEELKTVLGAVPREVLDIETDGVKLWGPRWYRMTDESGSLCAKLLSAGFESWGKGHKKATSAGMQTSFYIPASEKLAGISFDIIQPGEDCKRVRVRVTDERVVSVCGELPSNYEILEILEEA